MFTGYNDDHLLPFSEYGKLTKDGTKKLPKTYARKHLGLYTLTVGVFRRENDAKCVERAWQQMIMGSAGKGVVGSEIPMPPGCSVVNMKLSQANSNPGMGKRGLTVQDPLKPVYFVRIVFGKNVIGNPEIQNGKTWRDAAVHARVTKFQKPDEKTVREVQGCVIAATLPCLDEFQKEP